MLGSLKVLDSLLIKDECLTTAWFFQLLGSFNVFTKVVFFEEYQIVIKLLVLAQNFNVFFELFVDS